jgi:hypothetical protein
MSDPQEPIERRDPHEDTPDVDAPKAEKENAANDLDADIAVEEDTLKTVDPDNPPA